MNIYESDKLLAEYLLFHFGTPLQILGWTDGPRGSLGFPARIVKHFSSGQTARSLDLGCAVGRSAFELSRSSAEVVAIDFSQAFIEAAQKMQSDGRCEIDRLEEAHHQSRVELGLPRGVRPERIAFEQGDAMALREDLGSFDRLLAANLLCRLADPARLLERLPALVRSGGEMVLTTPCTWLEEFTPTDRWPSGTTLDWLKEQLAGDFEFIAEENEPFLIRETARKFQWTVALLTKWRRR